MQLAFAGAPVQLSVSVPLRPLAGVSRRLYPAVPPVLLTVWLALLPAAKLNCTPVPVSGTVCGEEAALSVTVSVPERNPALVGVKVIVSAQAFPAASTAGQVLPLKA